MTATATVPTAELDALRAIARAANVIAAGDLVDAHERAQVLDALPHLLDDLALTRPGPVTSLDEARAARRRRPLAVLNPPRPWDPRAERRDRDQWVAGMAARGALTPEHRAAYSALADAGVQPFQLHFLANAIACGVAAPVTEKES